MKNFFQIIGVLTLFVVSFSYHDATLEVVKMSDSLLEEIQMRSGTYKREKIEAIITNNTIVPGVNGMEVDINKSYNAMKQDGVFNEEKLVFKKDLVFNKLKDNKNKYIVSGNQSKKQVALILNVNIGDDTNKIITTLKQNETKATFFINSEFAKDNLSDLKAIIADAHTVGNLAEGEDYIWLKTLVTSSEHQVNNYCIVNGENKDRLDFCFKYNDYTIMTNEMINTMPLINLKKQLRNGTIIYLDLNSELTKEFSSIINYIISKGYKLVSLEELLQE